MPNPQVSFPAYFTPASAVAFANPDSSAQVVSAVTPLPVAVASTSGTQAISAIALPLPAGATTAANQATANATLSVISGQLPSTLGIKTAAASMSFAPASDASFVTTVADGAIVAIGARADVAWSTGSGTVIGILKALVAGMLASTPAGSNKIGGVTIADGDLNTLGARADTAAANTTSSQSVISLMKYLINATLAPLSAGTNLIGQVQPSYVAPATWVGPGTAQDMRAYSNVTVAVTTAPSAAYTPQWSPDGTSWFTVAGIDLGFATQTSIGTSFTGAITFKGGGYLRLRAVSTRSESIGIPFAGSL